MSFTSETHLTVRYAETDMMGIVHHSRYYPWFEQARTDYFRQCGMSYKELEEQGVMIPLTETHAHYLYGLTYEDEVLVTCRLTGLTVARCEFTYEVYKLPEKKLMTTGTTVHGFVGSDFVPINLKKLYPDLFASLKSKV